MTTVTTLPTRNLMAANLIIEIETIALTEDTLHNRIRNGLDRLATIEAATVAPNAMAALRETIRARIEKVHAQPDDFSPRVIELWSELSESIESAYLIRI